MKVVVYPHELIVGGSPINAIDLAAAVRDLGHEVLVYAVPGPLVDYIEAKGLTFVAARRLRYRPAPSRIVQLARLARREGVDVVHAYEWPPCLDAYYGAHLVGGVPVVCTVLSMSVSSLVPDSVPLLMGTRQLYDQARGARSGPVALMEPPIDTDADHPSVDGSPFRVAHGVASDEALVVIVSRLSVEMKLDSVVRTIDAVALLAEERPVRLVVVGTGEAFDRLRLRAEAVNTRLGRTVVTLAGPALDPRPAYAAADVVVGQGSSALRGLAFAKPVVIQGEKGFSVPFGPSTCEQFLRVGFGGTGDGRPGPGVLTDHLRTLLGDAALRQELGRFGRGVVAERYSLRSAAVAALRTYERALDGTSARRRRLGEAARMGGRALANEVRLHLPDDKRRRREYIAAGLRAAAQEGRSVSDARQ